MAGGKETPRQKMIGMMYLVLTALLALQVSSAIIQKFKFLDDSLQVAVTSANKSNTETDGRIKKAVKDNGGKAEDLAVLKKAEDVRKQTGELLTYINALRTELIKETGGEEKDESGITVGYVGAKEEQKVMEIMLGPEGSHKGKGYNLKDKLNAYSKSISTLVGEKRLPYKPLALDAKDDPMFVKDKEQNKKDFAELNFAQTPMVAALAVLSTKEAEMLKLESMALEDLATQVGASNLSFDQVFAMSRATSSVVAAGTDYEAEMFIAASSSALKPTFKYGNSEVPSASANGGMVVGKVKFKASAGAYDKEGNAKKTWSGSITIKNKGKDTTFKLEVPYVVARPVIQVQSASVQALYKNCGNELNVQVPALGSTYAPRFTASGATVVAGSQKGIVTLIPNAATVKLNVASGGTAIGSQDFKVRLIPKPEIIVMSNGKPVDEKTGMAAPGPRSLTVVAKPDESFQAFLPKDARYAVTQWMAVLVRGKRPVSTQNFTSGTGNLSAFAAQAQPGDRIMVEVKQVKRTNFLNQQEVVNLGTPIKNVPLN
jgi:gliding motility-associated protein GldM